MRKGRFKIFGGIFLCLFVISCLTSSSGNQEKRVAIYFEAINVGDKIEIGEDSLEIEEFKFAIDKFNLYVENETIIQSAGDLNTLIFGFNNQSNGEILVIDVGLGFSDNFRFTGYEMFLNPIEKRGNIQDNDFFGDDHNYSVIIKGRVNNSAFTFRSRASFEKKFPFPDAALSEINETLVVIKRIDIKNVFMDKEGSFLNPTEQDNKDLIIENIESNFEIEAYPANLF